MAVERKWVNITNIVLATLLLTFGILDSALSLTLNLYSSSWNGVSSISLTRDQTTKILTVTVLILHAVLIFPTAWIGISATISRHRGVYITLLVLSALSFLFTIGNLAFKAAVFSNSGMLVDDNSINDTLAILLIIFDALEIATLLIILVVTGIAVTVRRVEENPDEKWQYADEYYGSQGAPPPVYNGYTPSYKVSTAPPRYLTAGYPEWDKFYRDFYSKKDRSFRRY